MQAVLEQALAFSRGLIRGGHELVPRFEITCAEGDTTIFVQLPDDVVERYRRMELVQAYMKVKLATSFVFATELAEPDAHLATYVGRDAVVGMWELISRNPVSFSETAWLSREQLGDEIPGLLPKQSDAVSAEEIAEVEALIRHNDGLRFG